MDFDFKVVDEVVRISPIKDERKERMWLKRKEEKKKKESSEKKKETKPSSDKKSIIDIYV